MKKTLVFVIVVGVIWISSAEVSAINYYVDATGGNDNLDGRSEANAWATIAKVNDYAGNPGFSDGDVICFRRGDTWSNDETLGYAETYVNWGGIDGLTIQDYGTGAKPRFDGNTQRPVFIVDSQLDNLTIKNIDVSGSDTSLERVQIQNVNGVVVDGIDYNGHTGSSYYARSNCVNIINCTGTIEVKNCHIQNLVRDTWENTVSGWGAADTVGVHIRYRIDDQPLTSGSVSIHDNIIHDVYADCIQLGGIQTANSIYNNTLYNFGEGGLDLKSTSYSDVHHNEVYRGTYGLGGSGGGNSNISMHASASGYWPGYYCEDNTIRDNYIHTSAHIGVRLLSGSPRCKVCRNTFKSIRTSITMYSCPDSEIYSNIFICNTAYAGSGVDQSAIRFCATSTNNVKVCNNSFYLSSNSHFYGIAYEGLAGHGNGNEIKNNLIQMTRNSSTVFPFYYDGEGEAPVVNHNIFYNSNHSNRVNWGGTIYDGSEQTDWRNAGHTGGIFTNPQLVNPSIDDFHLQSTSPAIDAGIDVGLTSDFEGNVVPYGSDPDIGAFEFIGISCLPIDQSGWSVVFVDSEDTEGEDGRAINSFDGDPDTFWHTEWPENPPHPHEIHIDLGGFYDICGFRQLPRQGEYPNGMIKDYEFYVSGDGVTWGPAIASGTFASDKTKKQVTFDHVLSRYVRLVALSEVNDGPWTSIAELNVLAVQPDTDINNDGTVNIEDFADLTVWWDYNNNCVEPDWCGGSDFDMSGTVDFTDLAYFIENWLRQTPVNMPQATVDWYEDFEGETLVVDEQWPDCGCYNQDETWYHGLFWPTDYCYDYIEDDYNDRGSPDSGGKYWSHYCDWIEEATKAESQRSSYILANDTEWDGCNEMKVNDDTEYWIGWSYYIPADYYEEYYGHAVGQSTQHITNAIAWSVYYGGREYGHNLLHIKKQYMKGRIYHDGVVSHPEFTSLGPWSDFKGTWVDFVLHFVWHDTDDADAITELYINGAQMWSYSGVDNLREVATEGNPGLNVPLLYNTVSLSDPTSTWCRWFDENGDVEFTGWRHIHIDEFRLTEGAKGIKNYCHVAPPVWSAAPTITFPENGATGLSTTFTAQFDGYSDHRTDEQDCFAAYRMNVQVDDNGGDWTSLVYDSGEVSTATSHIISGLAVGTGYQMRVRHSSYCSARSTEHWGVWSDTVIFTTSD